MKTTHKGSGYLVETKSGRIGRTYHSDGYINERIAVYIATETKEEDGVSIPVVFSEKGMLFNPWSLKVIGFID